MLMKNLFGESVLIYLDSDQVNKCKAMFVDGDTAQNNYIYLQAALELFIGFGYLDNNIIKDPKMVDFNIYYKEKDLVIVEIKSFSLDGIKVMNPIEFSSSFADHCLKGSIFI